MFFQFFLDPGNDCIVSAHVIGNMNFPIGDMNYNVGRSSFFFQPADTGSSLQIPKSNRLGKQSLGKQLYYYPVSSLSLKLFILLDIITLHSNWLTVILLYINLNTYQL